MQKLPEPVKDAHGNEVTERVGSVVYTAKAPLPDGQRDAFELSLQLPDKAGEELAFPAIQTCAKGETAWTEVPTGDQDEEELEHPAPAFEITDAVEEGSEESAKASPVEVEDDDNDTGHNAGHHRPGPRCPRPRRRRHGAFPGTPPRVNSAAPRVRWRGWFGLLASALVGVALALGSAAPAAAHASLVRTDPTDGQVLNKSPKVARLTFDETVSAQSGGVQMYDARGDAVESEASARDKVLTVDVPDKLADGTYVISWRVVSADGHPVAGALTFSVGQPSTVVRQPPTPDASAATGVRGALSVAQGVGYLGLFLAAGLVMFTAWLLPGLPRLDVLRRRLRRIVRVSAAVAVLAGLVQLPLSGAYQQGLGFSDLLGGSVWSSAGGRELLGLGLLTAGLLLAVAPLGAAPLRGRGRVVATAGAVLAIASPSVVGHSRAYPPQLLVVATDVLHVAAGAVWFGGLVGLALSLHALAGRSRAAAETLARFSGLAAGVLTMLVAAGRCWPGGSSVRGTTCSVRRTADC